MINPLEKLAHEKQAQEEENSLEDGFTFECAGKQYAVNTEKVLTHEGNKYRFEIREQGASPSTTPLWGMVGMNKEELKELVSFMRIAASENNSIEGVIKAAMNHVIDTHAKAVQK